MKQKLRASRRQTIENIRIMTTNEFLTCIESIALTDSTVKMYPYTDKEKLYSRFLKRCFVPSTTEMVTNGWLGKIYEATNGIDLRNFHIVPFNNYFNKKPLPFEEFYRDWVVNHYNPNEILADFYAFMTDGKTLIGYLENLKDSQGNEFIAIAEKKRKTVNDVTVIASNIYNFFDQILEQLQENKPLTFSKDINYWRSRDQELDLSYKTRKILNYKLNFLFGCDSENYMRQ